MLKHIIFALALAGMGVQAVIGATPPKLTEGEQMALEISEVMLPPKKLGKMIDEHLFAIRKIYPEMEKIMHRAKWAPGQLILSDINGTSIKNINGSRYGPLKLVEALDSRTSSDMYRIVFAKPYNPARLVELMRAQLGVSEVEANLYSGDGNDINYQATAPTYYTYTFKKAWGDCSSGCTYKHYWEYSVAPTEETITVKLEKEYGSDLKSSTNA